MIYKFFINFNNFDFILINNIKNIPNIFIKLLKNSQLYDDIEMEQQLLLTIESFCDGSNSENRSKIVLLFGLLSYIGILLNECIETIKIKKKFYNNK